MNEAPKIHGNSWEDQKDQLASFGIFIPFDSPIFQPQKSKKIAFYRGSPGGSRSPRSPRSHWSWRVGGRVLRLKVKMSWGFEAGKCHPKSKTKDMILSFFFPSLFFTTIFWSMEIAKWFLFSWHPKVGSDRPFKSETAFMSRSLFIMNPWIRRLCLRKSTRTSDQKIPGCHQRVMTRAHWLQTHFLPQLTWALWHNESWSPCSFGLNLNPDDWHTTFWRLLSLCALESPATSIKLRFLRPWSVSSWDMR